MMKFLASLFLKGKRKETLVDHGAIDNENLNWLEKTIEIWKRSDLKLSGKASNELIIETGRKIGFIFPSDFVKFYLQFNGFRDYDIIGNMFSIWPLERIAEEFEKSDEKSFIPFCDYCIDIYRIGYLKNKNGVFNDYNQIQPIAATFEDTIRLIIEDSEVLYR